MADEERQIKSKERVRKRGEVFTAAREVNAMLDHVKDETREYLIRHSLSRPVATATFSTRF